MLRHTLLCSSLVCSGLWISGCGGGSDGTTTTTEGPTSGSHPTTTTTSTAVTTTKSTTPSPATKSTTKSTTEPTTSPATTTTTKSTTLSPSSGIASLVQTAKGSNDRLTAKPDLHFEADFDEASMATVDVSSSKTDQEIVGFGGAFTEATAIVFNALNPTLQERFLKLYFDKKEGIGYNLGRTHINSCDFSPKSYSFDDVQDDFDLIHFDTKVTHDTKDMIPLIKKAMERIAEGGDELKLFASPWSPPAWMKTSGQMDGSDRPGLRAECHASWAKYFVKWIEAYKQHGVPIWAVTVQNEPENQAKWEACLYDPEQMADFVGSELGPQLNASHPEVLIFVHDHNKDHIGNFAKALYEHSEARKYASGVAFHWYSGDEFDHVSSVHKTYPQAMLLPTEATWEQYRGHPTPEMGDWSFGEGYGHDILNDLNAGASGWTDWNMVLDQTGGPNHVGNFCDSPMMANPDKQELYVHPQYYYLGHFSKFLPRGSKHLSTTVSGSKVYSGGNRGYGTCTGDDGLQATAFRRPDGSIAVVALNCGGTALDFKLRYNGKALRASLPGHAIQTYQFAQDVGSVQV